MPSGSSLSFITVTYYTQTFLFNLQYNPEPVENQTIPSFSCFGEPENQQKSVFFSSNYMTASKFNLLLINGFYIKTFKIKHLCWLDLTKCRTKYCWVFVSLKPVYTYSSTVYVSIRAASHYADFSIKMLWRVDTHECYDICNLDKATKVVFLKCFGSTLSVIMSLTTNKSKNSFQSAILPKER